MVRRLEDILDNPLLSPDEEKYLNAYSSPDIDTEATPDSNSDLKWGMEHIQKKELAENFIKKFENKLCVYSASVKQLYSNYSMNFPTSNGSMVILPDPYAFTDTFNRIDQESIQPTGLSIVPGENLGLSGLYIVKDGQEDNPIPFRRALQQIIRSTMQKGNPFLPILQKGDLREFQSSMPCLHLNSIKLKSLDRISPIEKMAIKNIVSSKLMLIYKESK
jgi:hypothetical protein